MPADASAEFNISPTDPPEAEGKPEIAAALPIEPPPLPTRRAGSRASASQPDSRIAPQADDPDMVITSGPRSHHTAPLAQAPGLIVADIMEQAIEAAQRGDKAIAHELFQRVAPMQPDNPDVWLWLGSTANSLEDAEAAFLRARELDITNEKAALGLRWVALRRQIERTLAQPALHVRPARPAESPPVLPPTETDLPRTRLLTSITSNVFVLGVASFLTAVASEMIVPLRMLFLVAVLHTPLPLAGLVEGIATAAASLVSIFSGRFFVRASSRKSLVALGYSLSSVARPMLYFAGTWSAALGFIFLDRAGRGLRGSARDALLDASTPQPDPGKTFGFQHNLNALGAVLGPLLAFLVLFLSSDDVRAVFAWTAVPGLLALLVLVPFLRGRGVVGAAVSTLR